MEGPGRGVSAAESGFDTSLLNRVDSAISNGTYPNIHSLLIARHVKSICDRLGLVYVFKASFDKANRSSNASFRGPGLTDGLVVLERVKAEAGVPVLTDVHEVEQVPIAAKVVDILQVPAFLARQTDLLAAAAETGRPVHVKKGQFLAPWDMKHVLAKLESAGCRNVLLGERGTFFGYGRLVNDMRALPELRSLGVPVIFDATHSVQLPGAGDGVTAGQAEFIEPLAAGAVAVGVDGLFVEVHDRPERALSDGPNALPLDRLASFLDRLLRIDAAARAR